MASTIPAEQHRHRTKGQEPFTEVTENASNPTPDLPNAKRYRAATREWYANWANSPQAATFVNTDWQRLHMLAPIVDRYFSAGTQAETSDLRLIMDAEKLMGATHLDRLRARIRVKRDEEEARPSVVMPNDGTVSNLDAERSKRRRRIIGAD